MQCEKLHGGYTLPAAEEAALLSADWASRGCAASSQLASVCPKYNPVHGPHNPGFAVLRPKNGTSTRGLQSSFRIATRRVHIDHQGRICATSVQTFIWTRSHTQTPSKKKRPVVL